MRILLAEDDPVSMTMLASAIKGLGHEVVPVTDGSAALNVLEAEDAPPLALLDWLMPGLDGADVCREVRGHFPTVPPYLILVSARGEVADRVEGLNAGANDFMSKPFDPAELRARVMAGERILQLERELADRIRRLEDAFARVKRLEGLLPMCCYCHRIREGTEYWQEVDRYIREHTDALITHGICPDCLEKALKK